MTEAARDLQAGTTIELCRPARAGDRLIAIWEGQRYVLGEIAQAAEWPRTGAEGGQASSPAHRAGGGADSASHCR